MNRKKIWSMLILVSVLVGILLFRGLQTASAYTATAPNAKCSWKLVPGQDPSTTTVINGGVAVAYKNVWMVGSENNYNGPGPLLQTLTEQWNGTSWQVIASPSPGAGYNALDAIARVPQSQELWAVGYQSNTINGPRLDQTLIEHWDGKTWQVIPSPNVGQGDNDLFGVTALSPTDVWAVGTIAENEFQQQYTLIEHWDGTQWSVIPSLNPSPYINTLGAIAATSPSDIWATGTQRPVSGGQSSASLMEHWDGTQWSVVASPSPGTAFNGFSSLAVVSSTSVWAVGSAANWSGPAQTLVGHWDGTQWTVVPSPNPGSSVDILNAVVSIGSRNIWAVGYDQEGNLPQQTLTIHWDGAQWKVVPSPNSGSNDNFLDAITRVPATTSIWAFGTHFVRGTDQDGSLALFRC
ncbi:MAG TPA: hypothetical protein VJ761_18700 [Ktedonobacteraceae bacterium]|nr:hypothetical protein [Ktedonobacteraceae bacterium]